MELRSAKRDRDDQAVPPTLPPLVPAGGGGGGGGGGVAPAAVHMPGAGQAQAGVTAAPPNVVPPVVPNVVYMLSDTQISRIMANASSGEHFTPTTAWARAFAEQRVTAKLPAGCLNHRSPLFVKEPLCVLIAFGEQDTYFRELPDNALKTVHGTAPVDDMLARMIRAAWLAGTPWENPAIGLGEAQKHVAYNMQNLEDALSTMVRMVHMAPVQTYDFWFEETSRIRRLAGHYVRALDSWLIEWAKKNNKKELLRKDNFRSATVPSRSTVVKKTNSIGTPSSPPL